jgi:hypothetical protein
MAAEEANHTSAPKRTEFPQPVNAAIFSFAQTGCGNQVSASYPLSLTPPFKSFSLSLRAQACYPN